MPDQGADYPGKAGNVPRPRWYPRVGIFSLFFFFLVCWYVWVLKSLGLSPRKDEREKTRKKKGKNG